MTAKLKTIFRPAAACLLCGFSSIAEAQVALRGTSTTLQTQSSTANIVLNKPSEVVAGDLLIVAITRNASDYDISGATKQVTGPVGWTLIDQRLLRDPGSTNINKSWGAVFYKVAGASEGANYTFNLNANINAGTTNGAVGLILAYSGVGTNGFHKGGGGGGPFDVAPGTIYVPPAPTGSVTADSITTVTANTAIIMLGMVGGNNAKFSAWSTTSPGSLDEIVDVGRTNGSVGAAWALKSGTGATGNGSATSTITAQQPGGILLAIRNDGLPIINSFTRSPASIVPGESSTLSWNVSEATSISIDNGVGSGLAASGSVSVSPTSTTTYTLTASNASGGKTATATVMVVPPIITSFTATPTGVDAGQSSTLSWEVAGADTVTIDNGIGTVSASGSTSVSPAETTTYTLTATNAAGPSTATATVTILQPGPYRYYRFVPTELRTPSDGMVQISEFQMLLDGARVGGATASNPGGDNPGSEGPAQANDDSVETKWLDFNILPLVLDFGATTDVNGYRWATANDSDGRDPVSWRVEGSHDNANWKVLDTQTGQIVPTARKTYLPDYTLESFSGPTIASFAATPGTLFLGEPTSSTLSWTVNNADPGGVSIDNGIGVVASTDSLAVSPATTTTYTLTATGSGVTRSRTVTVRRVPVGSLRFFRFVPLATRGGGTPVGLSEFQILWNGIRVGGAVATNPDGLTPGGSGAPQANDNNTDTEWLSFNLTPVVLDFGDLVGFNGYRLATGVGGSSQDPLSWRIDGSADGENWTTLDERTDFAVPTERKTYLAAMPLPASAAPEIVSFTASPVGIASGGSSTLGWSVTGADSVSIDNGVGTVAASGSASVSPEATTTYTLSATNGDGTTTATATVIVISGTAATFDFDDKTFQGWTDLTVPNTNNGPRYFTASGTAPDGLFLRDGRQAGAGAIEQVIQSSEDNPHPTLLLRSPEFQLNGSGDLTAWLNGGPGAGTVVDLTDATLPANSSEPGFQGVALRNAGTGTYVLAVRKNNEGGWQQVMLTATQLAALDQAATYTLDLIDTGHGGWGWVSMDTVSIPGNFNHPPNFAGFAAGTPFETATEISLGKILAEASDPDGDALSVTAAGAASANGGTAVLGAEGILYTPPAGFSGDDTFSVTITDARGASVTGTVTVTVAGNSGVGSNPPTVTLLPGGDARIDFQGIPGRSYEVQRSTDLENWTVLSTVAAGPTGAVSFTDEDPPEGSAFYRLRKP